MSAAEYALVRGHRATSHGARRLNLLLRHKSRESLDGMFDDAAGTLLASFAASMRRDLPAVLAALDLPWTTSPAEGQINRIKRAMHGRARFHRLRARLMHSAGTRSSSTARAGEPRA